MSDPKYLQHGFDLRLAKVIEEMGEALAAAGKTQRWGRDSVNPELPVEHQEKNINWLLRELKDVEVAIIQLREAIELENAPKRPQIMDIYACPGTKVQFLGENGYEFELTFENGQVLTIKRIEVGDWKSSVEFVEYPGKRWNTVMFGELN